MQPRGWSQRRSWACAAHERDALEHAGVEGQSGRLQAGEGRVGQCRLVQSLAVQRLRGLEPSGQIGRVRAHGREVKLTPAEANEYGRNMPLATHARFLTLAVVTLPLLVAAPSGAATAKLPQLLNTPKFKSTRIVEGVSIGGVKVGMQKSQAVAAWGKPDGKCRRVAPYDPGDRRRGCFYGGFTKTRAGLQSQRPFAGFTVLPSGKVTSVFLVLVKWPSRDPSLKREYDLAAPRVRPFKTTKHIGLRSTMKSARDAYGLPTPQNLPDNRVGDFLSTVVVRQPNACTVFTSSDSAPTFMYIETISVTDAAFCPPDPEPIEPEQPAS
jgi:hypothetical protein